MGSFAMMHPYIFAGLVVFITLTAFLSIGVIATSGNGKQTKGRE